MCLGGVCICHFLLLLPPPFDICVLSPESSSYFTIIHILSMVDQHWHVTLSYPILNRGCTCRSLFHVVHYFTSVVNKLWQYRMFCSLFQIHVPHTYMFSFQNNSFSDISFTQPSPLLFHWWIIPLLGPFIQYDFWSPFCVRTTCAFQSCVSYSSTVAVVVVGSSKTLDPISQTTRYHIPGGCRCHLTLPLLVPVLSFYRLSYPRRL
jgi:hypothetical protein